MQIKTDIVVGSIARISGRRKFTNERKKLTKINKRASSYPIVADHHVCLVLVSNTSILLFHREALTVRTRLASDFASAIMEAISNTVVLYKLDGLTECVGGR